MRRSLFAAASGILSLIIVGTAAAATGGLDTSFSGNGYELLAPPGSGYNQGTDLAILSNGRIVISALAKNAENDNQVALARFTSSGSLDGSFNGDGYMIDAIGNANASPSALMRLNGDLVIAGWMGDFETRKALIARYDSNGEPVSSFGNNGAARLAAGGDETYAEAGATSDGKIVIAGYYGTQTSTNGYVARYRGNGQLDDSFSGDGIARFTESANAGFNDMAVLPNGKVVAAGWTYKGGESDLALVQFRPNGQLDDSFSGDGIARADLGGLSNGAIELAVTPSGKLIVPGYVTPANSTNTLVSVHRFRENGTLDDTFADGGKRTLRFAAGASASNLVDGIALQPDGKILLSGARLVGNENSDVGVARLKSSGALDDSFSGDGVNTIDLGGWDYADEAALQDNGRLILVGGSGDSIAIMGIDTGL